MLKDKIRQTRIKLGLTQEEFAKKVHTSNATICFWERGRSIPKATSLELLKKLGVEIQKDDIQRTLTNTSYPLLQRTPWSSEFDIKYTLKQVTGLRSDDAKDDWKKPLGRPIKPSVIKQFIVDLLYKKQQALKDVIERRRKWSQDKKYIKALNDIERYLDDDEILT